MVELFFIYINYFIIFFLYNLKSIHRVIFLYNESFRLSEIDSQKKTNYLLFHIKEINNLNSKIFFFDESDCEYFILFQVHLIYSIIKVYFFYNVIFFFINLGTSKLSALYIVFNFTCFNI